MERTPLDKAKACCNLHDKGTDRLLADIASAPDANSVWARRAAEEFIAASGVLGRELDTKFLSLAFERAILRGHIQGANSALDKMQAACGSVGLNGDADTLASEAGKVGPSKACNASPTDIGDGLEVPERFCESTGPFGKETDHDRHNDNDSQRAAQARADAEESNSDND